MNDVGRLTIMFVRNYNIIFVFGSLCLCTVFCNASEECDRASCLGPLFYYEEIGCTPIFENTTSCCPTSYNCDHWENLPLNQCWVGGHVYNVSQVIPAGFLYDPCRECTCKADGFSCTSARCSSPKNQRPGCRYPRSSLTCCQFYEICEDSPVVCTVDGKSYKVGETFTPLDEPQKTCYCRAGYDGVNDERFCVWRKPSWCFNVIGRMKTMQEKCLPIFKKNAVLYKDCNTRHICPLYADDCTIENTRTNDTRTLSTLQSVDPAKQCKFGHLTTSIGEKFRCAPHWEKQSRCVCEVPPLPTCYEIE